MEPQGHASANTSVPTPSRAELIQKYHQQLLSGIERIKTHLITPGLPPEKVAFLTKKQAELEGQLLLFRNKYIDSNTRSETNQGNESGQKLQPSVTTQSIQGPSSSQSGLQASGQSSHSQSITQHQPTTHLQQQGNSLQGIMPPTAIQYSQNFPLSSQTSARQIMPTTTIITPQMSGGGSPPASVSPQGFSSQFLQQQGQFPYLQQQFNPPIISSHVMPSQSIHGSAYQSHGFHFQANQSFGLFSQTQHTSLSHSQGINPSPTAVPPPGMNSPLFPMNTQLRMQQAPGASPYYNPISPSVSSSQYFYHHAPQQFSPMVQYRVPQLQQLYHQPPQSQLPRSPAYPISQPLASSSMTPSGLSSPPGTTPGVSSTPAIMFDYSVPGHLPDTSNAFLSFSQQQVPLHGINQQLSAPRLPLTPNFPSDTMIRKPISPKAISPSQVNVSPAMPLVSPIPIHSESSVSPPTSIRRSALVGRGGEKISQIANEVLHSACGFSATAWLSAYDTILLDAAAIEVCVCFKFSMKELQKNVFSYLQFLVLNCILTAKFSGRDGISVEDVAISISNVRTPTSTLMPGIVSSLESHKRAVLPVFPLDVRTFPARMVQRRSALLAHKLVPSLYYNTFASSTSTKRSNVHTLQQRLLKKASFSSQESSSNTQLLEESSLTDPNND